MHGARNVYPSDEESLQFPKEMSLLKVTCVDIFPGSFRLSIFSNGCRRLKVTICIRRPYSNACHDLTGCLNHSQERWKTWKPLIHQTWTVRQIKEKAIALEFWIKRIDLFIHFIVKLCIVYDEIKDSELSMKIHQIEDLSSSHIIFSLMEMSLQAFTMNLETQFIFFSSLFPFICD